MSAPDTTDEKIGRSPVSNHPVLPCPLHVCDQDSRVCGRKSYDPAECAPTIAGFGVRKGDRHAYDALIEVAEYLEGLGNQSSIVAATVRGVCSRLVDNARCADSEIHPSRVPGEQPLEQHLTTRVAEFVGTWLDRAIAAGYLTPTDGDPHVFTVTDLAVFDNQPDRIGRLEEALSEACDIAHEFYARHCDAEQRVANLTAALAASEEAR